MKAKLFHIVNILLRLMFVVSPVSGQCSRPSQLTR